MDKCRIAMGRGALDVGMLFVFSQVNLSQPGAAYRIEWSIAPDLFLFHSYHLEAENK